MNTGGVTKLNLQVTISKLLFGRIHAPMHDNRIHHKQTTTLSENYRSLHLQPTCTIYSDSTRYDSLHTVENIHNI